MLQIFPFLVWIAIVTSAALLIAMRAAGDLGARGTILFGTWWCVAAWCQFCATSPLLAAAGLAGQTVLAVVLLMRWKLSRE